MPENPTRQPDGEPDDRGLATSELPTYVPRPRRPAAPLGPSQPSGGRTCRAGTPEGRTLRPLRRRPAPPRSHGAGRAVRPVGSYDRTRPRPLGAGAVSPGDRLAPVASPRRFHGARPGCRRRLGRRCGRCSSPPRSAARWRSRSACTARCTPARATRSSHSASATCMHEGGQDRRAVLACPARLGAVDVGPPSAGRSRRRGWPRPPLDRHGRLPLQPTRAYHCLWALGFKDTDTRVLAHSILGCAFYGAFTTKMLVLRSDTAPRWALPVMGGALVAILTAIWLTSSLWFFTNVGFPGV